MAKKILKGFKTAPGVVAAILGSKGKKKKAPKLDAPLNPMLSMSSNMEKDNRAMMRKRAQTTGSGTILSDTLG